ncbi:MAG: hypothetical protein ACK5P7_02790 [Bdellovibrio sp.]
MQFFMIKHLYREKFQCLLFVLFISIFTVPSFFFEEKNTFPLFNWNLFSGDLSPRARFELLMERQNEKVLLSQFNDLDPNIRKKLFFLTQDAGRSQGRESADIFLNEISKILKKKSFTRFAIQKIDGYLGDYLQSPKTPAAVEIIFSNAKFHEIE